MKDLKIEKLSDKDLNKFIKLIKLFEDVFEMQNFCLPDSAHLQNLLNKSSFHVFVANIENEIVGGLTAYTLDRYYAEKPLAYIYDLAVRTTYQRQGIGKKLVSEINRYCNEHGFEEVFVQADKADDYALNFYRLTKPTTEEAVVHFSYSML